MAAAWMLPYKPSFPYSESILAPLGPRLISAWANFDGVHYLTIISKGYFGTGSIQAFFPLYPYLVRLISSVGINPLIVGLVISTVSFWMAIVVLYKLVKLDYKEKVAMRSIVLLLFFPTAFFFTAFYTESWFFFFCYW